MLFRFIRSKRASMLDESLKGKLSAQSRSWIILSLYVLEGQHLYQADS
jgi:hypothetical protein